MSFDTDREVISIFGRRGSGKTTKAKELLNAPERKRIVIFDIKGEYPYTKLSGKKEFAEYMANNWNGSFKVSYVPKAREKNPCIKELSDLCNAISTAQEKDCESGKGKNITILVEEMSICAPNQKTPDGYGGFEAMVNLARSWGVEIIGISQRPAQVNTDYRGNSSQTYYFGLSDDLDIKAARQKLKGMEQELDGLQPHEYFLAVDGKGIIRGRNKTNF